MASIWKGALSFGLVNIPVSLHPAVRADERISFRQLHNKTGVPIRTERVDRKTGKPVAWEDIVKGYEYEKGRYVVLTAEDFKSAALTSSKTIDVLSFVPADDVDPRFFETPYYLVPAKGGEKAYALLREAVRNSGMIGIGKITLRSNSQHLAAVRAVENALVLELMRFAGEIVDPSEYSFPEAGEVRPQEMKMAEQLIENLAEPFDPEQYTDEYRANLMRIIEAKREGRDVSFDEQADPEPTPVLDLMARLKASLEKERSNGARKSTRSTRSRTARKGAAKAPAKRVTAASRRTRQSSTRRQAKKTA